MIKLFRKWFRRKHTKVNAQNRQTKTNVRRPKPSAVKSWAITYFGKATPQGTDYHIVDLFEHPNFPRKVDRVVTKPIAYFSVHYENWRPDAKSFDLKGSRKLGSWKGERVVNWNLEVNRRVIELRLDRCMELGFWGVDLDNVDQFMYGRHADKEATIDYLLWFIKECHNRGLKVGLKNCVEVLPDIGDKFDFFVSEASSGAELQCYRRFDKPTVRMGYGRGSLTPDFIYEVRNKQNGSRY